MDTIEHISPQFTLFSMLYGGAAGIAVLLCFYLLLRKGNAIVADITPPVRLRRWAAAFFGVAALSHLWWLLFYLYSLDSRSVSYVVLCLLDCVALLTTIFGVLLSMLQDRQRPLWPIVTAMIPIAVLGALQIVWPAVDFMTPILVYAQVLCVLFTIYMVVAVRQYGRWLRDNYADLEHKEVWLSDVLVIVLLLLVVCYGYASDALSFFLIQVANFILFALLLWRVETLPTLSPIQGLTPDSSLVGEGSERSQGGTSVEAVTAPFPHRRGIGSDAFSNIEQLLDKHCVDTQLYLQHDLSLVQLSAAVGINRSYLSQYFSSQGMNYNAYINGLRINHFVCLYSEAVAARRSFTVQQLASASGYRSYSTFSLAFKQRMGQSVTAWMRETAK